MRYRLPLELELTILEIAAPPLAIDSLHARVDFFINVSLVHRSFTALAQDRLRDQFLYTYRPRPDEHGRLKTRFEAGFGRDQPVRRLYLDLSDLPKDIDSRKAPGTDSVSATINGRVYEPVSSISGLGGPEQVASKAQEQACDAVAHYVYNGPTHYHHWKLCAMVTSYSQALNKLWIRLPYIDLNIQNLPPPRVLYIDDGAAEGVWGLLASLPLASETVLFLRNIFFRADEDDSHPDTRHLIFDECFLGDPRGLLGRFRLLETFVLFKTEIHHPLSALFALPTTIRRVHIIEQYFFEEHNPSNARHVLPHLESFTYTLLSSGESALHTPAGDERDPDALAEVQQAVESIIVAPRCTFKYVRSMESPEEALANALATFNL